MPIVKKQMLRIVRLAELLKSNSYPNCSSFARMMQKLDIEDNLNVSCSAKTIYRDIQTLKNDFNAPIEFDPSRNGYYLTDHSWTLFGNPGEGADVSSCLENTFDEVIIHCDRELARHLLGQPLHNQQHLTFLPDGSGELQIKRIQQNLILPWLMRYWSRATVIAPHALRCKICDVSEQLLNEYKAG